MITDKSEKKIITARSKLMKGNIGMASMLLSLDLVEASDRCDTMATDGKRIYWNRSFVDNLTEEEIQGVLIHEACHVIWEHPLRRGNRHPKIWNIATDYVINAWLHFDLRFVLPQGGLIDRQYRGMSANEVYRILTGDEDKLQEAIDQINEMNSQLNPNEGEEEESDDGQSKGDGDSEDDDSDQSGDSNGDGGSEEGEAEGNGTGKYSYDDIPNPIGEVWDAQDKDGKPLNESELTELTTQIQRSVMMGDRLEKAMSHDGTSALGTRVDDMKKTEVCWKDELSDFLKSSVADDNSWARLNRRFAWQGINLPSKARLPQGGEIAIAIDTSASVDQNELDCFASEIQSMAEDCGIEKVRVCYCDTTVRKNSKGEWWDIYELDQGEELVLEIRGGGGTEFDPPFNLFNDYSDDVDDVQAFIYFTDGFGYVSEKVEPNVPVIWCCTEESSYSRDLAFGETVYVDVNNLR
tara:strand:+ start:3409 stop:4803 length:1395 start_codon:yes stop_codon:yes gene_type:complete